MAGTVAAVVVAAGRGLRAGGDLPKQYRPIGGRAGDPAEPCDCSPGMPRSALVQPVIHPDDRGALRRPRPQASSCCRRCPAARRGRPRCAPGSRRCSARAPDIVLVHDAARPFASPALITRAIAAARETRRGGAGAAGRRHGQDASMPTGARRRHARPRAAARGADAAGLRASPRCSTRIAARAAAGRDDFTDDAALAEWAGLQGRDVRGRGRQHEAHHRGGFRARRGGASSPRLSDVRTGFGFDVHAFGDGDHVMLGGVRIPHRARR